MCRWLKRWFSKPEQPPFLAYQVKGDTLLDRFRTTGRCPDCDGDLHVGPQGCLAVNVKCSGCANEFNIGFAWGEAFFVERI